MRPVTSSYQSGTGASQRGVPPGRHAGASHTVDIDPHLSYKAYTISCDCTPQRAAEEDACDEECSCDMV